MGSRGCFQAGLGLFVLALLSCNSVLGVDRFYVGLCTAGQSQCAGENSRQLCQDGQWAAPVPCVESTCYEGQCAGECVQGERRCAESVPQECDAIGTWQSKSACLGEQSCQAGACIGGCTPGDRRCLGGQPELCGEDSKFHDLGSCQAHQVCDLGVCVGGSSCQDLAPACGLEKGESCCDSPLVVGGKYFRSNMAAYPGSVGDFRLDRFEATVGRFRAFVEAYPGSKPVEGEGAHPRVKGSGWRPEWNVNLPADQEALELQLQCGSSGWHTWSGAPGVRDEIPINCVDWYLAFAFCAWDGGRLPTEAEWNYAAAGGIEQRVYPWSVPPNLVDIAVADAVYNCGESNEPVNAQEQCDLGDISFVGSRLPKGESKWGQADLAGSMWEWCLDSYAPSYMLPCEDCAVVGPGLKVIRGGSWGFGGDILKTFQRFNEWPAYRSEDIGIRCARDP